MSDTHLEDGALHAVLDGELHSAGAHLSECYACRARLEALRVRAGRVRAVLVRTDYPVPDTRLVAHDRAPARGGPGRVDRRALRIAAAVGGLLAIVSLATPARAWIGDWLERGWSAVAGTESPAPTIPAGGSAGQRVVRRTVEYSPAGAELRITLARGQRAGALRLERGAGNGVRVEVLGEGDADVLVLPEGIRIGNAPDRAGGYRVRIPESVEVVEVRVGDAEGRVVRRDAIPAGGLELQLR